eukprot:TRINITY_DN3906_c0_g1_i1.p1 TRINITY_DN3906_c0_g1~~TRINITY_DN3906_c0_g1_i1.p1  ORF type:complete len:499 (-),score=61.39 TRINITY_DN3906_c0_g1_i1:88-1584(-)
MTSMMESGGRKERGEMNAFELFTGVRGASYKLNVCVPVMGIISSSADREAAYAAGAHFVKLGRRKEAQENMINKLTKAMASSKTSEPQEVLWCDSNSSVSSYSSRFEHKGYKLVTFPETEEWVEYVEAKKGEGVVAVISSTMESGGRKERGLLNCFQGFARVRAKLDNTDACPCFAVVSGSSQTKTCYEAGCDIAICRDNEERKARHPSGSMWDDVIEDVCAFLDDRMAQAEADPTVDPTVVGNYPSYWQTTGDTFSEMVQVDDKAFLDVLEKTLQETFKRGSNGLAKSTKDRPPGSRPKNFHLQAAYRIEDSFLWNAYQHFSSNCGPCTPFLDTGGASKQGPVKTSRIDGLPPLNDDVNEAYLWHGTNPDAAANIIHTGFRIDLAGTAVGCAFGKGAYLAEASTKSDEYAHHGSGLFSKMYAMLLCRTCLGKVAYTEEFYHSSSTTRDLVDDIIAKKTYDTLLGDRESAVGTYREFIVFNKKQIYPEFVLLYHRECE